MVEDYLPLSLGNSDVILGNSHARVSLGNGENIEERRGRVSSGA